MKKKLLTVSIAVFLVATVVAALIIIPKTRLADLFAKKIRVGVPEDPPYSFVDGSGNHSGFSADFIKTVLEELGYKVIFVLAPADEQDKLLQNGEIDCYIDTTSNDRPNTYYTKDYIACVQGTLYKDKNIKLQSKADLKGYRCAFVSGNSNSNFIKKNGGTAVPQGTPESCAKAVKENKADICIIDNYFINDYLKNRTEYSEFTSGIYLYNQKHYFAFSKDYSGLVDRVNKLITKYKQDGTAKMLLNIYGLNNFAN